MAFVAVDTPARGARTASMLKHLRRSLDRIYLWSVYLAAASMVIILLLTMAQIASRYAHLNIRGLGDYAGYFMAASAFLAFPYAFNQGAHVRITLFTGLLGRFRHIAELVAFGVASLIAGWFAYYACTMVFWSYKFNDVSTGLDATPLWIPQSAMAFGAVLFAVAIADQFLRLLLTGSHTVPESAHGN